MAKITEEHFALLAQDYVPLEDIINITYAREYDRTAKDYLMEKPKTRITKKIRQSEESLIKKYGGKNDW